MNSHIAWQESKNGKPGGAASEIHGIEKTTILFVEDEDIVAKLFPNFCRRLVIRF